MLRVQDARTRLTKVGARDASVWATQQERAPAATGP